MTALVTILVLSLATQSLGGVLHHPPQHSKHHKSHRGLPTPTSAPAHNHGSSADLPVSSGYGAPAAAAISTGYGAPAAAPISTGYGAPLAPPVPAPTVDPVTPAPQPEVVPEIPEVPEFLVEPQPIEDIDLAHPAPPVFAPGFIRTNAMNPRFSVPFTPVSQYVDDGTQYVVEETNYVVPYSPFGDGFQYFTEDQPSGCTACGEQTLTLDPDYYMFFEDTGELQNADYGRDYAYDSDFPVAVTDTPEVKVAKAVFDKAYQEALRRSSG
ncbi:hypothetical protein TCAL_00163 [Tigriopus californicus]|uniref:DUF4794 domain-containing protein n=1 Tax=Tigriopus californicus TaxID=6832 RepID=A0A553PI66_TIGCA|nr:vitelline membrane protein Vm26Ab-like [Tigriopus californicus]TRY77357.1 hypothetical protein TCAL_00163 [Tigriopus californicus]|eukprot:TCALIF_00163-PA protein Name:"Protein of unknown function" AED:0.00 eAED:0.00 QI:82/1/1/1/0/0.5/2/178/267